MIMKLTVILPGTADTSRNILERISRAGVDVRVFPLIGIKIDEAAVRSASEASSSPDFRAELSVFTSKTAVKIVHRLLPRAWEQARSSSVAIGPGTAHLLRRLGSGAVHVPAVHSSAGLIELLKNLESDLPVVLYCSKDVNVSLKKFFEEHFERGLVFELYTVSALRERVEKLVDMVRSNPSEVFLIVLPSSTVLKIISEDGRLKSLSNVVFSALSERIADEAVRAGIPVSHYPKTVRIDEYYSHLLEFIRGLVFRSQMDNLS